MELVPSPRGLLEVKGLVMKPVPSGFVIKPVPLYALKNDSCEASVVLGFFSSAKKLSIASERVCTGLGLRSMNRALLESSSTAISVDSVVGDLRPSMEDSGVRGLLKRNVLA